MEIAVSDDGSHVTIASNGGFSFSDDGGKTFNFGGGIPCIYDNCDGDPSLAIGKSGAIYFSWIGKPTGVTADAVSVSNDNGHTFTFVNNAVVCHPNAPPVCDLADQPHVAADRFSLSSLAFDRVYLVWRKLFAGTASLTCSIDGASTWTRSINVPESSGDYPRIAVGGDGSVYVTYISNSNIMLRKFSTCDSGLNPQPEVVVRTYVGPQACGNSPGPAPSRGWIAAMTATS